MARGRRGTGARRGRCRRRPAGRSPGGRARRARRAAPADSASPSRSRTWCPWRAASAPPAHGSSRATARRSTPTSPTRLRRRRRGDPGQDQHGRVRDGLLHGALRLRADQQPVGPRPRSGWVLGRLGCIGGCPPGAGRHRDRHRRLGAPAGGHVRDRRHEAHLRSREPVRDRRVRLVAGPGRADRAERHRHGCAAARRRRSRRARLDLRARPGPGRPDRPAAIGRRGSGPPAWTALRPAEGVLRGGHGAGRRGPDPRGGGGARGGRCHRRGGQPSAHGLRSRDLLHRRAGRGIRQPGPLRRRPVRPQRARW